MRTFSLQRIRCSRCGDSLASRSWGRACPSCGGMLFRVEIRRAAKGIDPDELAIFLAYAVLGTAGPSPYYALESLVVCDEVSAEEILLFQSLNSGARRDLFIRWKRRALEAGGPVCRRCQVAYRSYDNEWNRAGLCSRACHQADRKSSLRSG